MSDTLKGGNHVDRCLCQERETGGQAPKNTPMAEDCFCTFLSTAQSCSAWRTPTIKQTSQFWQVPDRISENGSGQAGSSPKAAVGRHCDPGRHKKVAGLQRRALSQAHLRLRTTVWRSMDIAALVRLFPAKTENPTKVHTCR